MENNKIIGLKIKELRSRRSVELGKKITQKDLANELGISRSYLGDIESGRTKPNDELLQSIASILNVDISELNIEENYITEESESISHNNESISHNNESSSDQYLPSLNNKDEKDIAKKLNETLEFLETSQDGLMFEGEILDDQTKELLRISLENSMKLAKQIAKKKFTPNKYK